MQNSKWVLTKCLPSDSKMTTDVACRYGAQLNPTRDKVTTLGGTWPTRMWPKIKVQIFDKKSIGFHF